MCQSELWSDGSQQKIKCYDVTVVLVKGTLLTN